MYPGSNNYNQYSNQPPGGASIGFNVGQPGYDGSQTGYVPGQPGYVPGQSGYVPGQPGYVSGQTGYVPGQPGSNASQGHCQQYVPGMPSTTTGQIGQSGQGQYFPQQPVTGQNPGSSWNQNQGMGPSPPAYGGSYQPMDQSGYGGHNQSVGQPYNPQPFPPTGNVTYQPVDQSVYGGHNQSVGQPHNPQPFPPTDNVTYQPVDQSVYGGHNQSIGQPHNPQPCIPTGNVTYQPTGPQTNPSGFGGSNQPINQGMGASGIVCDVEVVRGTMKPHPNFDEEQDSKVLRTAMKGIGTDEKSIIECLGCRTLDQRLAIKKTFKTMYGKDLIECLKSELSGDFCDAVVDSLYDSDYYDAHSLFKAMKGAGTREAVLTEILTSRTNEEIENIKVLYKKWFNADLEKNVISETSGFYKRVLVSCLQANKKELTAEEYQKLRQHGPSAVVNVNQANQEAAELYNAGEKKLGTDEAVFIKIFAMRNKYQLRATFAAYEKLSGHNIIRAIESEMSGDLASSIKALATQAMNEPLYFATRLYKAMKGAGTNDTTLIRVILTRSEIDLDNIKKEFQKQFNKSLTDFVREDTSGDYQKYLLRFVEGN